MRKQSFIIEACLMPGIVVGCHLLCLGSCLARGVVLQLFVQTYHRLLSAFWHFYNQCLFNSFRQVIWLECESKVCCNGYGLTQNVSGNKKMVKFGIVITFLYPCMGTTPFWQGNGTNPAPDTHSVPHTHFFWCRNVLYVLSYYPEPVKVQK
jgi:hypothetical protein